MKLWRCLLAVCVYLLCSLNVANATNLEFHRWQFGEFAASLRYLQFGIPTKGINDIYAKEISTFIKADDVRIGAVYPDETMGTLKGSWTFWGARMLPLLDTQKPRNVLFYAVSYLGQAKGFHEGASFDAIIDINGITGEVNGSRKASFAGISHNWLKSNDFLSLTRDGSYAPVSWNSLDIDGDGKGDFTFGGWLYLSGYKFKPIIDDRAGSQGAFVHWGREVFLVRLNKKGTLFVEKYHEGRLTIVHKVEIPDVTSNSGHSLVTIPGMQQDFIGIRTSCGLSLYSLNDFSVGARLCIGGLKGGWAMPGASGDFDGDGYKDIWLSQTMIGDGLERNPDHIRLLSGKKLATAHGFIHVDDLTIASISGSRRYSDYDGIATTLSPIAGDMDGDGKPDLTFSGHRHMNEAGALYILFGKDIVPGMNVSIENGKVIKIVGPLMSQLAPPYHHWDATDFDGDGYDDIVVSADNDLKSGLNAGAIYLLSGRLIVRASTAMSKGSPPMVKKKR